MKNLLVRFKILRLCHGGHFDHYGPGRRGDLLKNQQAKADRISQRVLTEVVTDLGHSYQRVTQEGVASVENPAKLEEFVAILPCTIGADFGIECPIPFLYPIVLHKNIDSLYLLATSRVSMSPCLITRRYLSLPAITGGKQVSADHYKAPATAIPVL